MHGLVAWPLGTQDHKREPVIEQHDLGQASGTAAEGAVCKRQPLKHLQINKIGMLLALSAAACRAMPSVLWTVLTLQAIPGMHLLSQLGHHVLDVTT